MNVIPLVGLMGIEGCDTRESDYRKVDQAWSCWRVTPMATNIQLVFFRRPDGGDVLVKFLFNERESRIRLESDLAPYYRWNDVKRYFDERIATQTRRLTRPRTHRKEGGSNIAATLFRLYGPLESPKPPERTGSENSAIGTNTQLDFPIALRLFQFEAIPLIRRGLEMIDIIHPANRHTASYPAQRAPRPAPPAVAVRFASTTSFRCCQNIPRDVYDLL